MPPAIPVKIQTSPMVAVRVFHRIRSHGSSFKMSRLLPDIQLTKASNGAGKHEGMHLSFTNSSCLLSSLLSSPYVDLLLRM